MDDLPPEAIMERIYGDSGSISNATHLIFFRIFSPLQPAALMSL
jgi:hypothetical protein